MKAETEWPTWADLIHEGSDHYKTELIQPIDLYTSGGMFRDFACASIIKYAFRCRRESPRGNELIKKDMAKVIHYARLIVADLEEDEIVVNKPTPARRNVK
jgi:hypothetical protein